MNGKEFKDTFDRIALYEYTNLGDTVDEVGEEQPDTQAAPGMDDGMEDPGMGDPGMGGDPGMADPGMGDPGMGGDPAQDGEQATPPEGFAPQGIDQNAGIDGMGGQEQGQEPSEDEEVIDVDDLTDSQEKTEKKVDALSDKFSDVIHALKGIMQKIDASNERVDTLFNNVKKEVELHNPTPMQRLTMRSAKSSPYSMTPNEYMNNYAPDNYSADDDNNGADDPQYKITKDDIDNFTNYQAVANDFKDKNDLRNIFGY
jgi:hypothetical protein